MHRYPVSERSENAPGDTGGIGRNCSVRRDNRHGSSTSPETDTDASFGTSLKFSWAPRAANGPRIYRDRNRRGGERAEKRKGGLIDDRTDRDNRATRLNATLIWGYIVGAREDPRAFVFPTTQPDCERIKPAAARIVTRR